MPKARKVTRLDIRTIGSQDARLIHIDDMDERLYAEVMSLAKRRFNGDLSAAICEAVNSYLKSFSQ
jgi:hypothetical protein